MKETQKFWLREIGERISEKLDAAILNVKTNPVEQAFSGWFVSVGRTLRSNGGHHFMLFLDESSRHTPARLWYGYMSKLPAGLKDLQDAGENFLGVRATRDDSDRKLMRNEFDRPFAERNTASGSSEYYYGIYVWREPNLERRASERLVDAVSRFANGVCRELTRQREPRSIKPNLGSDDDDKLSVEKRMLRSILGRRGQTKFRKKILDAYGRRCCISGCLIEDILEAAHVLTLPGADLNVTSNGLLLRADLHTLYDLGLLRIDPRNKKVVVDRSISDSEYQSFHGKKVTQPSSNKHQLDTAGLQQRWHSS